MSELHKCIQDEYPYVDAEQSWAIDDLVDTLNTHEKRYQAIRQILCKNSLSVEQKLTLIAFTVASFDESTSIYGDATVNKELYDRMYDGLFQLADVSVL